MGCQGNGKRQDKNTNQEGPMFRKLEILFHKYLLGKSERSKSNSSQREPQTPPPKTPCCPLGLRRLG